MKLLHHISIGAAMAVAAIGSQAQQIYSLDPAPCGLANTLLECTIDAGPPQPTLDEYSWGTFSLGSGHIVWENNSLGHLGTSIVTDSFCAATQKLTSGSSSVAACSTLTVLFYGNYLPIYGGASYSGIATINFSYAIQPNRWSVRWGRNVTGGAVKIY